MVTIRQAHRSADILTGKISFNLDVNYEPVVVEILGDVFSIKSEAPLSKEEENAAIDFASKLRNVRIERSVYP